MITAVDTCVLLDLLLDEPARGVRAEAALRSASAEGALILGEVVYAELRPQFADRAELDQTLAQLGIAYQPSTVEVASLAGELWAQYRASGGRRQRVIADFLVGAHAAVLADRLLTRDKRFYSAHFSDLAIVEP
jgi:hypothetical protein